MAALTVLFITHYSGLYGANRSLIYLLEGLKEYPIHPLVVLPEKGDLSEVLRELDIEFLTSKIEWWCGVSKETPDSFFKRYILRWNQIRNNRKRKVEEAKCLLTLQKRLGNLEFDVVHSNSSVFDVGLRLSEKYGIPHIWHLRESQEQYNLQWFYSKGRVSKTMRKSKVVLAVSHFLKNYYEKKFNLEHIQVLYNGILSEKELYELDILTSVQDESQKKNALTFGMVGLLHPKKNQSEAIKALKIVLNRYPETNLIIVGGGDSSGLKKLAIEFGVIENVQFLGHFRKPLDAFVKMDVFLMCSRMEGFGRVTAEAMAANLPIIGFREGGTEEIIEEGITGIFYKTDFTELAEKMIYLIENPQERTRMGRKGRQIFEKKYLSKYHAENFYNILLNITSLKK